MARPETRIDDREARRAAFAQSVARLQQASSAAASTLLKVMVDPTCPPSTRVRAADSVLSHTLRAIEIEDIQARVAAVSKRSSIKTSNNQMSQGSTRWREGV